MSAAPDPPVLVTERLRLRGWRAEDLAPMAAINADPEVMRHIGPPLGRRDSDLMVGRFLQKWQEEPAFGWWAVEHRPTGAFIGFIGLNRPDFAEPPAPCVEIGWRLARQSWGYGLATEGAQACLAHGFERAGLTVILSFTVPDNAASRRVMEKLGLRRDPEGDFDHPLVPVDDPRCRHVLYRIDRRRWLTRQA